MWFYRLLNRLGLRKDTIVCIRQADAYFWPKYLGNRTDGKCEQCKTPIYYEEQNKPFRKICHACGGYDD